MNKQPVVLYLRSATQLGEDDDVLKVQEKALSEFARQAGYEVTEIYQDFGSGYHENRTGLQALLADAKAGRFKTLIVRDYARLSRNQSLTRQIEQTLAQCEITILTPDVIPSISTL